MDGRRDTDRPRRLTRVERVDAAAGEALSSAATGTEPAVAVGFARLSRDSAVFATGAVAGKLFGLLTLPLLARKLTPSDFGRLDVLSTLESALISALLLGLDVAATRLYFDHRSAKRRRSLMASWFAFNSLVVLLAAAVLLLAASPISRALFGTSRFGTAVALVGFVVVAGTWQHIALTVVRVERRPGWHAAITAVGLGVNAALLVAFFVWWHATVTTAMLAMALGLASGALLGAIVAYRWIRGRPTRAATSSLLRLGLPLAPALTLTWAADFSNRAILLATSGPTEVGYFSIAIRFQAVALIVVSAFQLAWQPDTYSAGTSSDAMRKFSANSRRVVTAVGTAVVLLALVSPEAIEVVAGARYAPALPSVGWILLAALGATLYIVATIPSVLAKAMRDLAISGTFAVSLTVPTNILLCRVFGSAGTAAAVCIGQLGGACAAGYLGRRRVSARIPWWSIVRFTCAVAGIVAAATLPAGGATPLSRASLALLFAVVLAFEKTSREVVRYLWNNLLQ